MTRNDDMVITPQIATGSNSPRVRAREERQSRAVRRKRGRLLRKLRLARAVSAKRRGRRRRTPVKAGPGVPKGKIKAAGPIGIALLVVDAIVLGTQLYRRISGEGSSARLLEAQDADTVMGLLDEEATANAEVLGMVEGNPEWLRAIGREGKVNASSMAVINRLKAVALTRAQGADMIARDPHFDSADTLLDKLLMSAEKVGLKDKADDAIREVRGAGFGKVKSGR